MEFKDMPKWMNIIPVGLGVALAIAGMYLLPLVGIRNIFGPIIGLPVGYAIGFAILFVILKSR